MAVMDRLDLELVENAVVRMPAELDCGTVRQLCRTFARALRDGTGAIVLDCAPLTFIDASGIGALVWAANAADEAGREVRLARPGPALSRMLRLTGIRQRFVVEADDAST